MINVAQPLSLFSVYSCSYSGVRHQGRIGSNLRSCGEALALTAELAYYRGVLGHATP